jgi:hypothetical protein
LKIKLFLILSFLTIGATAQVKKKTGNLPHSINKHGIKDTTIIESDTAKESKEPRYFYTTIGANVLVNTRGGVVQRLTPSIEFGRTYGIFDFGVAIGKLNSVGTSRDSSIFTIFRPTIKVFSKGRFSEGLCFGAGYVYGAKQSFITEICNSINFNISATAQVSIVQGYYFLDGTDSGRSAQFMGINFTYNLLKPHSINNQRKKAAIMSDN